MDHHDQIRLKLQSLSQEQTELFNIMKSGENVYFTGKAGSGKTEVLKIFIQYLRSNKVKLGVTVWLIDKRRDWLPFNLIPIEV